jgi:hypothetical protein
MIHTHFDTSIRVFCANSAGEYLSDALHQVLTEQGTLAQFGVARRHHGMLSLMSLVLSICVPPLMLLLHL